MAKSKKVYVQAPDWKQRCEKVKKAYPQYHDVDSSRIIFLKEIETEGKKLAYTMRIANEYKAIHPEADYLMVFHEKVITKKGFTEAQKLVLVMHEMEHIDAESGKLIKHDLEEFHNIVSEF